jgi:FKBP-type peptidyl-prolyl cis-trans isomerase
MPMLSARCSLLVLPLLLTVVAGCDAPPNNGGAVATPEAPPMPTAAEEAANRPVPEGFTQTDSGLRYKIFVEGEGTKPTAENSVVANYRGWLDNGEQFDAGQGIPFPLSGVIPGWTEGLQLIGEGGKIELEIPSQLAYGESGRPGIPPNAWLHFEVELLKVE